MINSTRHALVFAMLSTASGWGLPSHDSLLSPNESGVDGPRDRRKLGSGSSCDGSWSVLPTPRPDLSSLTLPLHFLPAATHKPPIPRVTIRVTPAAIHGVTPVATPGLDGLRATTAATAAATPTATPTATPVAFSPAAILSATRVSVSSALLTIPAPQSTSLVAHMPRLAGQTAPLGVPLHSPSLTPTPPRVPDAGTPSLCNSGGFPQVTGLIYVEDSPVVLYAGCTKLGGCDDSWSVPAARLSSPPPSCA